MESLVVELSERYLASGRAAETGDDRKALIALYARKLREYPADVALDAVSGWRGTFFPAFEELREAIMADRRMLVRRQKMAALRAFLADDQPPGEHRPPTDAQIARNADWVRQARNEVSAPLSAEKLARLAEVDRIHGDAAKPRASRATVQ